MINNISDKYKAVSRNKEKFTEVDAEKLKNIGDMISSAKIMLRFIISLDNILNIKEL